MNQPPKTCTACGRQITEENPAWVGCGPEEIIYCKSCCTVKDYTNKELLDIIKEPTPKAPIQHDSVNHPAHYTSHPSGVECITISEHFMGNLAQALQYIWRAGLKTDNPIEDLKKAAWYVNREIKRLSK